MASLTRGGRQPHSPGERAGRGEAAGNVREKDSNKDCEGFLEETEWLEALEAAGARECRPPSGAAAFARPQDRVRLSWRAGGARLCPGGRACLPPQQRQEARRKALRLRSIKPWLSWGHRRKALRLGKGHLPHKGSVRSMAFT